MNLRIKGEKPKRQFFVTYRDDEGKKKRLVFVARSLAEAILVCRRMNGINVGMWT